jgi:protoporphyrinogen oxidase
MKFDVDAAILDIDRNYEKFRVNSTATSKEFTDWLSDIIELAKNKHKIYNERQKIIRVKYKMIQNLEQIKILVKEEERHILNQQKFGNKIQGYEDNMMKASNDFERKIYMRNYMRKLDYLEEMTGKFITLTDETIKSLDHIIYAIPYIIELEKQKGY